MPYASTFMFYLFNGTASTEIYTDRHTHSLQDALPICCCNASTDATPIPTAITKIAALTTCWPGKTKRRSINPCNLANAIREPENEIAPIRPPVTPRTSCVVVAVQIGRAHV